MTTKHDAVPVSAEELAELRRGASVLAQRLRECLLLLLSNPLRTQMCNLVIADSREALGKFDPDRRPAP